MESEAQRDKAYVLGSDREELDRLDQQAASIERATRLLLQAAGIGRGLRVLDLGTGLGHVARMAGELVGPGGSAVGIDNSGAALAVARRRVEDAGERHVSFVEADARRWRAPEPFDAVIGRLILFHLADPAAVVRHHAQNLRAGGVFVAIDFDLGAARTEPPVPLAHELLGWVMQAFSAAGASPRIGARLGTILTQAGLRDVATFGIQGYLQPGDPMAPRLLGGIVRSLSGAIVQHGIATADQLGLATLESRIAEQFERADAVMLAPTVVGAWGRSLPESE
jgi:ubiquinone/menaquinone biosynthesis C-methylase UbiE